MKRLFFLVFLILLNITFCQAQKTEIQYLSGTGSDHTVNWDFKGKMDHSVIRVAQTGSNVQSAQ